MRQPGPWKPLRPRVEGIEDLDWLWTFAGIALETTQHDVGNVTRKFR